MKKATWIFDGIFNVVLQNWSALLGFEMVYRGIVFTVLFPLFASLLRQLPRLIGERYLGQENLPLIVRNPAAVLLVLGIAVLAGLSVFFEITALFLYAEKGWRREHLSFWSLWRETAIKTVGLLRPGRLPVLLLLPVMTLSIFAILSGYLKTLKIPEFIMDYILADGKLLTFFIAAVILCHLILFLYLFGFPSLLFSRKSFKASWNESMKLLRGKKLRTAGILLGYFFLFVLVLAAAATIGVLLIYCGVCLTYPDFETAKSQFELFFRSFREVGGISAGALASSFFCAGIVILYHRYDGTPRPKEPPQPKTIRKTALRAGTALATLMLLMIFSESELGGRTLYPEMISTRIVAHRAGASFAPENTVAALNQAIEDGADIAEIDVWQLGDGTLIVMHDTNFKRTTGVDLDVWDADIETVRSLDAGSFFSSSFAGEPVATLEDMLLAAKGRIDLMIELKSSGKEQNLIPETLALIRTHGMENQCVIASMDGSLLREVKSLSPEMQTVLISAVLLTEEYDLSDLDAYSIETTSLSMSLVVQAHALGKQVYVWTANSKETIDKALSHNVDGLVTDNPLLAVSRMNWVGRDAWMEGVMRLLFPEP